MAQIGSQHHKAKLTEEAVALILKTRNWRDPVRAVAKKFGVSPITISRIRRREAWTHVAL